MDATEPEPCGEGGDAPCWSHLFEDARDDIVDRHDIEVLVRNFYRDAAMDDLLGPVFEAARVKLERAHRDADRLLGVAAAG